MIPSAATSSDFASGKAISAARKLFEDRNLDPSLLDMVSDEPLVPELEKHLVKSPLGQTLRHPLVLHVIFSPMFAHLANRALVHKREKLTKADAAGDFYSAIMLHERPFRLEAFLHRQGQMGDPDYWSSLSKVWTDSEFPHVNNQMWRILWNSKRPGRHWAMDASDLSRFEAIRSNSRAVVWRGAGHSKAKRGLSWTTDRKQAEWFASRFGDRGRESFVWELIVPGSKAIAFLTSRGESEIIIDASKIPAGSIRRVGTGGLS